MILALTVAYAVLAVAYSASLDVTVARAVGGGGSTTTFGNAISALSSGSIVLSGYTNGYVAGTLVGSSNGIVRVYGADGSVLWTKQEATVAGGYLQFVGSTIDSSDKIYALARCSGSYNAASAPGGIDVCVTKYDSGGNRLSTFESGGASDDLSYGIAVNKDASYLYIVGTTNSPTWNGKALIGEYDGFLLKMSFSGSTGSLFDVYRFGDTSAAKQQTQFYAVAYDSAGYVWVAGFTKAGTYQGQTNVGGAGGADFLIQRMKADGTVVFARLVGSADHELAYAIAVDQYNNAYVTGVSFSTFDGIAGLGGQDVPVVMYSGSGVKQWSKTFGGSGNDFGRGVTYDKIKNVLLVTGNTISPIFQGKTNPITTGTGSSFVLVLNPSDGSVLSVRIYSGSSASTGNAIATNAAGVYLAGTTYGSFQGQTLSGTSSAYMLKVERYTSAPYDLSYLALGLNPGGSVSNGYDVAMFSNGDLVLGATTTGYLEAPSSNVQLMVQRYSSSGNVIWTAEAGGTGNELLSRVTVDRSDNTYAVGSSNSPFNGVPAAQADVAFAKFNSTGGTVFYSQFGGSGDDYATAVAVDSTGSFFYVVGTTTSPILNGYALIGQFDSFVTMIDAATGAIVRHRQFGSGPYGWTYFQAAAIDSTGSLWVAGSFTNGPSYYGVSQIGGLDMFIQKFDSVTGSSAFVTLVGGAGEDDAKALSIDANDNLYGVAVSGSTSVDEQTAPGAGSSSSILVVKWNSAGTKLWTKLFGGAGSDEAYASAVDSNRGLLYLTGKTDSATFYGATNTNSAANPFLLVLNVADGSVAYAAVYSSTSGSQGNGIATNGVSTYMVGTAVTNLLGQTVNPFMSTFLLKLVGNQPGPTAAPSRAPTAIITRAPTGPSRVPTASPTSPYIGSAIVGANPYSSYSAVYGIAGFSNGDVLMAGITTGYRESPASNNYYFQFLFQRFTPSGTLLWSVEAGGSNNEFLTGVAVDVNNVAYASGLTYSASVGGSDVAYAKITQTSGTSPVATYYKYGGTGDDSAAAVAVDSTGSFFYLVGKTNSPTLQGRNLTGVVDGFVTKINVGTGAIVWHRQFGCATCTTSFSAAVLDSAGNLWVTGTVEGGPYYTKASYGGKDLIIQKFTTSLGDYTFVDRVGGTGDDTGVSIALDSSNNVYAAGNTYSATVDGQASPGAGVNMLVVKLNATGVKQWTTLYGGDGDDTVAGITIDFNNNQLILGSNTDTLSSFVVQYNPNGDYSGKRGTLRLAIELGVGAVIVIEVLLTVQAFFGVPVNEMRGLAMMRNVLLAALARAVYTYSFLPADPAVVASFMMVSYAPLFTPQPTLSPTILPSRVPTRQPSRQPTSQPSRQPSSQPTSQPSRQPSRQPTSQPSRQPTSQPSASPTNVCGTGWTHYGNKCYKTSLPSMTFNACRAYCPSQHAGAGMLCIENSAQNDFVASHITANSWMGYTNELTNGTYYWGSGCFSTHINWGVGQPDNFNNRQHWAVIRPSTASPGGVWDDIAGSFSCNCEYALSTTCTVPGARRLEEEVPEEAAVVPVTNDALQQEEQHEILSAAALAAVPAIPVAASTPKLRGHSLTKSLLGGV